MNLQQFCNMRLNLGNGQYNLLKTSTTPTPSLMELGIKRLFFSSKSSNSCYALFLPLLLFFTKFNHKIFLAFDDHH